MEKVSVSKELMRTIVRTLKPSLYTVTRGRLDEVANQINEELPELFKEKFEVGKWLKISLPGVDAFFLRVNGVDEKAVSYDNCDYNGKSGYFTKTSVWAENAIPATPQEIENHLTALKEKKGFKHKVKFIAVRDCVSGILYKKEDGEVGSTLKYDPETDTLYTTGFGKYILYEAGQWATIIEEKPDRKAEQKKAIQNIIDSLEKLNNNL